MTNEEKVAIVLLSLDKDLAADVMKNFTPSEVKRIGRAMGRVASVSNEDVNTVAAEFCRLAKEKGGVMTVSGSVTRDIIIKAMGEEAAESILEKIDLEGRGVFENPITEKLRDVDPKMLVEFTKTEHPQTIALILSHMRPEQASDMLETFPVEMQVEVVKRMATLKSVPHEVIEGIAETLETEVVGGGGAADQQIGGVKMIAETLNLLSRTSESAIMEAFEESDPELAEEIRSLMFTFEDILVVEDKDMQELLREISSEDLGRALKVIDEGMREKVFKNMSKRGAEMLKEDIELMPPVRLSEVEKSQRNILDVAKRLEAEGKITISRGGEEDKFV